MGTDDRGAGRRWWTPPARVRASVSRHETLLWWLHSVYVLGLGAVVMWLGARNYAWLRFSAFYLLFIWISSLFLAEVINRREGVWWCRARLTVNYVNKNFYQQLLFFILPIYAGSTTLRSGNVIFVIVLGTSAVLSTLDIVYDRVLSARRTLAAWFFAFNVFAVVNLALPVLFGLSNAHALRVAAVAAVVGFVTLAWRMSRLRRGATWAGWPAGALLVLLVAEAARPLVPPAPLRLLDTEFGSGLDRGRLRVTGPVPRCPPSRGRPGVRLHGRPGAARPARPRRTAVVPRRPAVSGPRARTRSSEAAWRDSASGVRDLARAGRRLPGRSARGAARRPDN